MSKKLSHVYDLIMPGIVEIHQRLQLISRTLQDQPLHVVVPGLPTKLLTPSIADALKYNKAFLFLLTSPSS